MKKHSFGKFGVILAMMLVAGAALVGPVSAVNPLYTDYFELTAGGNVYSGTVNYYSCAQTLSHDDAEYITTTAVLYDEYDNYIDHVTDSGWYESYEIAEDSYSPSGTEDYVLASFESVDPADQGYYAKKYF